MTAEFSLQYKTFTTLQVLGQAYGADSYSSNSYNGQQTTATTATPLAPNTGLHLPSSTGDIVLLFVLALVVGSVSFALSKLLKRYKHQ